jgi:hypothetical protein
LMVYCSLLSLTRSSLYGVHYGYYSVEVGGLVVLFMMIVV